MEITRLYLDLMQKRSKQVALTYSSIRPCIVRCAATHPAVAAGEYFGME